MTEPILPLCPTCEPIVRSQAGRFTRTYNLCNDCQYIRKFNPPSTVDLEILKTLFDCSTYGCFDWGCYTRMPFFTSALEQDIAIGLCMGPDFYHTDFSFDRARYFRDIKNNPKEAIWYQNGFEKANRYKERFFPDKILERIRKRMAARRILRFMTKKFGSADGLHAHLWKPGGPVMNRDCHKLLPAE